MTAEANQNQPRALRNDTAVNVAGLLRDQTGAARHYRLLLDALVIDGEMTAREIDGELKLTRLGGGILASVEATGTAAIICVRCLREYDQQFAVTFDEEYRQMVDLRTGVDLVDAIAGDEGFSRIDENHELDVAEPLRQEILVALPMRPDCGDGCPGPDVLEVGGDDEDEAIDERLAALASLLPDEQARRTG